MVRAPCCEKMGMKKGPWTPEEDQILIDYIQQNGHGNWRALPRHAGLLRCGKSCRLRWTNYLRPDIKRGNFSKEEEDIVIELHELLGNRWSAIAAKLPGRTDNEIKNVWHTHIKKKAALRKNNNNQEQIPESGPQFNIDLDTFEFDQKNSNKELEPLNFENYAAISESTWYVPVSPQQESSNDISVSSSTTITSFENNNTTYNNMFLMNDDIDSYKVDFPEMEGSFWSDALLSSAPPAAAENYGVASDCPLSPLWTMESVQCK